MSSIRIERNFCKYCKKEIEDSSKGRICSHCKHEWDEWYKVNPDIRLRKKLPPLIEKNFLLIHTSIKINPPNFLLKNNEFKDYIGVYDNKTGDYYVLPEPIKVIREKTGISEPIYALNIENPNFHEFFSESYYIVTDLYSRFIKKEIGVFMFRIIDFQLVKQ